MVKHYSGLVVLVILLSGCQPTPVAETFRKSESDRSSEATVPDSATLPDDAANNESLPSSNHAFVALPVRGESERSRNLFITTTPELPEHNEGVCDVAFSGDGKLVATVSHDEKLKISDAKTGEIRFEILLHNKNDGRLRINSVVFAPNRPLVAVASSQDIWLFDSQSGEEATTISDELAGGEFIQFTSSGDRLVAMRSKEIVVWSMPDGQLERKFSHNQLFLKTFALTPDGNILAMRGEKNTVDLLDLQTGKVVHQFTNASGAAVGQLAINADGSLLATVDSSKNFVLYDLKTRTERFRKDDVQSSAIAFSPDGLLVIGFYEVPIYIVGKKDLYEVGSCRLRGVTAAGSLKFSPDGSQLIGTDQSHQHRADLFALEWSREVQTIASQEDGFSAVAASDDGNWLAWADRTSLVLYSLAKSKVLATRKFKDQESRDRFLTFSPDSKHLAVRVGTEKAAVMQLYSTPELELQTTWKSRWGDLGALEFTPDGEDLAMFVSDGFRLWNLKKGEIIEGSKNSLRMTRFVGDDRIIGVHDEDQLGVYQWPDGNEVFTWDAPAEVQEISISPQGNWAAVQCEYKKMVSLWSFETGKLVTEFAGDAKWVSAIAVSADGKWVLASGSEKKLVIVSSETGLLRASLPVDQSEIESIVAVPDSSLFYTAGNNRAGDNSIKQWDLDKLLAAIPQPSVEPKPSPPLTSGVPAAKFNGGNNEPAGYADDGIYYFDSDRVYFYDLTRLGLRWSLEVGEANWVSLSPDGQWLAASFGDDATALDNDNATAGVVKLWDSKKQRLHKTITLATSVPERMCFSPDSTTLAVASGNIGIDVPGELSLWNVAEASRTHSFSVPKDRVTHVQFSPDGALLAAGGFDRHVTVWDVKTKKQLYRHSLEYQMDDLQFSPNGKMLGVCGGEFRNGKIDIYAADTGKRFPLFDDFQEETTTLAFSPAGDLLIAACTNDRREMGYRIWSLPEGRMMRRLLPQSARWGWGSIFFTPDGGMFAENAFGAFTLWRLDHLLDDELQRQLLKLKEQRLSIDYPSGRLQISFLYTDATDDAIKKLPLLKYPFALKLAGSGKVTDAGLAHLANQVNLRELDLGSSSEITPKGLAQLSSVPVTSLDISGTNLNTAEGLAVIGEFQSLESLVTYALGDQENPIDLAPLVKLAKLRSLELRSFAGKEGTLASIGKLINLERLRLTQSPLTDEDCAQLAPLENLLELELAGGEEFTGAGLAKLTCKNLKTLSLSGAGTAAGYASLAQFKQLRMLLLSESEISNAGLAGAAGLVDLRQIELPRSITDEGLAHLAELTQLTKLDLSDRAVTDAGLLQLIKLNAIEELYIDGVQGINGSGLAAFAGAEKLVYLDLTRVPGLTAEGFRGVAKMSSLTELDLPEYSTDACLASLDGMDNLIKLSLDESKITDAGSVHLTKLPNLENLHLESTALTDASVPHLASLEKLSYLEITGTGITKAGKKKLKKSFPDLHFLFISGP